MPLVKEVIDSISINSYSPRDFTLFNHFRGEVPRRVRVYADGEYEFMLMESMTSFTKGMQEC